MKKISNIKDVAEYNLCSGCGACAFIDPKNIKMIDDVNGKRPKIISDKKNIEYNSQSIDPMDICPGINLDYNHNNDNNKYIASLIDDWGPIRNIYEGFASDKDLRFAGSSGGVSSALAIYGIEQKNIFGLLHIASQDGAPYFNQTLLSTSKLDIIKHTGSRYSPASPCDGLDKIIDSPKPCVIIGKPCDIAAVQKVRRLNPELDKKISLTIAIFCRATPTNKGTLKLLKHLGIKENDKIKSLRYRGNGWPGDLDLKYLDKNKLKNKKMSYYDSWGFLSHERQWRCNLCIDHTGEFADISVGDPWFRETDNDIGRSLVLIRTKNGEKFYNEAVNKGYIKSYKSSSRALIDSQPSLLNVRSSVWGRLLALRILGVPTPKIKGANLFKIWLTKLSFKKKIQSIIGTIKRVFKYKINKRVKIKSIKDLT